MQGKIYLIAYDFLLSYFLTNIWFFSTIAVRTQEKIGKQFICIIPLSLNFIF